MSKTEKEQNYSEVTKALDSRFSHKYPNEISGGNNNVLQQRASVHKPAIIFADEPTGALDSKSAQDLLNRLEDLNKI